MVKTARSLENEKFMFTRTFHFKAYSWIFVECGYASKSHLDNLYNAVLSPLHVVYNAVSRLSHAAYT